MIALLLFEDIKYMFKKGILKADKQSGYIQRPQHLTVHSLELIKIFD